jgi:hypothetical protein
LGRTAPAPWRVSCARRLEQEVQFDPLVDTQTHRSTIHSPATAAPASTPHDAARATPAQLAENDSPAMIACRRAHRAPNCRHRILPSRMHCRNPIRLQMTASPPDREPLAEGTLISHLLELRTRLLRSVIAIVICFIPLAFYQDQLFTLVASPLIDKLPKGTSLICDECRVAVHGAVETDDHHGALRGHALRALPGLGVRGARYCTSTERRFAFPLVVSSIVCSTPAWRLRSTSCSR